MACLIFGVFRGGLILRKYEMTSLLSIIIKIFLEKLDLLILFF